MHKIYTATFHGANNYGAVLQAYALQKFLLDQGYVTEILDYDNLSISKANKVFVKIDGNIIKTFLFTLKNILFLRKIYLRNQNFNAARKMLKLTSYFADCAKLPIKNIKGDIFIVGSDQIWSSIHTGGIDDIYTLNFSNSIKKISYGASCGNVNVMEENKNEFKKRLNSFDYLSVRENSTCEYLNKLLDKKVSVVLDPSLLLKTCDWVNFAGSNRLVEEKYIFAYEVSKGNQLYYDVVNELARKTGYKIVFFDKNDYKHLYKYKKLSFFTAGPIEWVNLILNAEYVVTSSFHGTAFSVALNKKLFVVLSASPDRLTTLIDKVKLNDCIVKNINDFDRVYNSSIDWKEVNKLLEAERKKSADWLTNAIESCKNG